ncbi:MAG: zinc ribbon domain-containing protein [Methanoregula sp.]
MAYPDLYNDESVLLNAQNVKVKSVTFEAILTTKRLILVDSKKHIIAPQEILLATLRDVEGGENAIRDSTLTLSLITNSGATRQMILTFSKTSGGDRKRECDEWIRVLKQNLSPTFQHHAAPVAPEPPAPAPAPEPMYVQETPAAPRIEITNAPQPKKKIEIARPIKKIVEVPPAMPKPVETTSLPMGSFCNRCGNRVPPDSVFCNRCGTPVVRDPALTVVTEEPVPAPSIPPAPAPALPVSPPPPPPQAAIPQMHVPIPPPVFGSVATERRERPIEQVIHSIEPLIADSVPRTEPSPLIQKPGVISTMVTHTVTEPAPPEPQAIPFDATAPVAGIPWPVITPDGTAPAAEPAPATAQAAESAAPVAPVAPAAPETPAEIPPPPPPAAPKSSKKKYIAIAVAVIVILAVIGSVILFALPQGSTPPATTTPATTAIPTATPELTVKPTATPAETAAVISSPTPTLATPVSSKIVIPSTGVWVRVYYPDGNYAASIGTPGAESAKADTGEHIYQISTSTGIVVANVQKVDSTGKELLVEVYKNGNLVTQKSTTSPKGVVEIQVDLKPTPTPTIATTATTAKPVTTATTAVNATANQTAKAT